MAESSSCPARFGPFVLGDAPGVLLDGLSGDGCPDVTAPHPVDLRVRRLRFVHRTGQGQFASHIAWASRLVGVVHDDRDVHPVGDVELGEQSRYV